MTRRPEVATRAGSDAYLAALASYTVDKLRELAGLLL